MAKDPNPVLMPTEVSSRVGFFDRFAGRAAHLASRAPFFAFCLLLVLLWLVQGIVTIAVKGSFSSFLNGQYQLEINTTTTIVTFLMVALLQNSQTRNDQATQHKLNAIADGLADLMQSLADGHPEPSLLNDARELKAAVGLEDRESTGDDRAPAKHGGADTAAGRPGSTDHRRAISGGESRTPPAAAEAQPAGVGNPSSTRGNLP